MRKSMVNCVSKFWNETAGDANSAAPYPDSKSITSDIGVSKVKMPSQTSSRFA